MIYGIANKKTVVLNRGKFYGTINGGKAVVVQLDTTASRYPVESYKLFRKFPTRSAARAYKRTLKNPQHYAIINTRSALVVR